MSQRDFLLGYGGLIALGTILLRLPIATTAAESIGWFEALFTAVSAVCLVGLTVVDTATGFTPVGQSIILGLIQLGALFYLFFAVPVARRFSLSDESASAKDTLRRILLVTVLVESGAFVVIFYAGGGFGQVTRGEQLFATLFHTVSAFGNAGFSTLPDNLYTMPRAFVLHLAMLITFVLGSLGVDTLYDLFSRQRLRQRLADPSIDWRPTTKLLVNTSIALLGGGAVAIYLLEQSNTLSELNLTEKLIGSLFQSATTRTAGFSTVAISQLTVPALWLLIGLMLIGGGVGSTAGGIKIDTFYGSLATQRNQQRRPIKRVARWMIGYALAVNAVGALALRLTETDQPLTLLIFEQVSAFSSVGLSPVDTATLSLVGQTIVLLSMLLGRVGILVLFIFFTKSVASAE